MNGVTWRSSMDGKNYGDAMNRAIELALRQAGIIVEEQAVALAPVDTGRLKGSITWRTENDGSEVREPAEWGDAVSSPTDSKSVYIGTNVEYAQHIEYGVSHVGGGIFRGIRRAMARRRSAQAFLRPALHEKKQDITRDFAKWVQEYLKRGR